MANHLDLEEQEQLDQIKHLWKQYGNLVTWLLIAVLGAYAAWNIYQYWQRNQAAQASAMFDEVERVARTGDLTMLERAFTDMKDKYARTSYAQQTGLLVAKVYHEAGKLDAARTALEWVAEHSSDDGYQAIARLRLAAILAESKSYAQALARLDGVFPPEFAPLVADRKGDILVLQGKSADAKAEYEKAFKGLDERTEYRRLVEIKLHALGIRPGAADSTAVLAAGTAASGAVAMEAAK